MAGSKDETPVKEMARSRIPMLSVRLSEVSFDIEQGDILLITMINTDKVQEFRVADLDNNLDVQLCLTLERIDY